MIKATESEKDLIVQILSGHFEDGDNIHTKDILEYAFEYCLQFGKVYLTDDFMNCTLFISPLGKSEISLILSTDGIQRFVSIAQDITYIKPSHNQFYVWFLSLILNLKRINESVFTAKALSDVRLTPTQIEILELIKMGKKTKEIAEIMNVAFNTVSKHLQNIYKKTGIKGQLQLYKELD